MQPDGNVLGITLWVRKMANFMIFTKNYVFVQNDVKISSGQNVLNFLFVGAPSFSNKPKLGLKAYNVHLLITTNIESLIKGMLTIKYENVT